MTAFRQSHGSLGEELTSLEALEIGFRDQAPVPPKKSDRLHDKLHGITLNEISLQAASYAAGNFGSLDLKKLQELMEAQVAPEKRELPDVCRKFLGSLPDELKNLQDDLEVPCVGFVTEILQRPEQPSIPDLRRELRGWLEETLGSDLAEKHSFSDLDLDEVACFLRVKSRPGTAPTRSCSEVRTRWIELLGSLPPESIERLENSMEETVDTWLQEVFRHPRLNWEAFIRQRIDEMRYPADLADELHGALWKVMLPDPEALHRELVGRFSDFLEAKRPLKKAIGDSAEEWVKEFLDQRTRLSRCSFRTRVSAWISQVGAKVPERKRGKLNDFSDKLWKALWTVANECREANCEDCEDHGLVYYRRSEFRQKAVPLSPRPHALDYRASAVQLIVLLKDEPKIYGKLKETLGKCEEGADSQRAYLLCKASSDGDTDLATKCVLPKKSENGDLRFPILQYQLKGRLLLIRALCDPEPRNCCSGNVDCLWEVQHHLLRAEGDDVRIEIRDLSQDLDRPVENPEPVEIEWVEYNCHGIVQHHPYPDDPDLKYQWGLDVIHAMEAWKLFEGSELPRIRIALIDSGVDYCHDELRDNLRYKTDEVVNFNSEIDRAWNLPKPRSSQAQEPPTESSQEAPTARRTPSPARYFHDPYNYMDEEHSHGTFCAGIIGAVAHNRTGIAGLYWRPQVMPLKFIGPMAGGSVWDATRAILLALERQADILLLPWGSSMFSRTLYEACRQARDKGVLIVTPAGNLDNDLDRDRFFPAGFKLENGPIDIREGFNGSQGSRDDSNCGKTGQQQASADSRFPEDVPTRQTCAEDELIANGLFPGLDNIIVVGSTTGPCPEQKAANSSWGRETVDLGAPGYFIRTTRKNHPSEGHGSRLGWASGTSMAAAFVAGALALIKAKYHDDSYHQLKERLILSADPVPALEHYWPKGRRLNVYNALVSVNDSYRGYQVPSELRLPEKKPSCGCPPDCDGGSRCRCRPVCRCGPDCQCGCRRRKERHSREAENHDHPTASPPAPPPPSPPPHR